MQVAIENELSLASYVSHARSGQDVVLTEHGQEVARIVAMPLHTRPREAAIIALREVMRTGIPLGGKPFRRDELYDRD